MQSDTIQEPVANVVEETSSSEDSSNYEPIVFIPRQFDVLEMPIGNGFLFDSSGLLENGYRLPVRMGEFYAVDPDLVEMNGLGAIVQATGIKEGSTTLVFNVYNWQNPSYSVDVHIPVTVVSSVYGW